jgi:hypothetical protein
VLPSSFSAPPTIKRKQQSNPPKLITHPTQSHPSTQREKQGKKSPNRERKLLFACFVVVLVTWMSFASGIRELRGCVLSMPETHIVMSSLISRFYSRASSCTSSRAFLQFSYGHNHRSYGFGSQDNHFGCGPRPHRDDRFPRRPDFPTVGSYTHFELRHLDGPRFAFRGSRPTQPSCEVQRTVKTSSGRMVKC